MTMFGRLIFSGQAKLFSSTSLSGIERDAASAIGEPCWLEAPLL